MSRKEICPKCGDTLYDIPRLYLDRDGIRSASYCDSCSTVFRSTCSGIHPYKILRDRLSLSVDEKVISALSFVLKEVAGEAKVRQIEDEITDIKNLTDAFNI
jgi:hypothetical protein